MRSYRATLAVITAGLLTFGLVFTVLQVTRSDAAAGVAAAASTPTSEAAVITAVTAPGSVAPLLAMGRAALGVPTNGSESLLRDVQPGDRLDILASVPAAQDGRPVTAVMVRGATVLRPGSGSDPLLIDVSAPDAMVLAHLILGGTHLEYAVWPAGSGGPPEPQPLDERTARALLGLAPSPEPQQTVAAVQTLVLPTPFAVATAAATPSRPVPTSGFIYQAQADETWDSVASALSMSADDLRRWNEAPPDAPLTPGTLLFVPRQIP